MPFLNAVTFTPRADIGESAFSDAPASFCSIALNAVPAIDPCRPAFDSKPIAATVSFSEIPAAFADCPVYCIASPMSPKPDLVALAA